jgi:hypothetical protein
MPKTKSTEKKIQKPIDELEKIVEIDEETKVDDIDLVPGVVEEDDTEEEDAVLDDEEIDPFKDKWEE